MLILTENNYCINFFRKISRKSIDILIENEYN